jgi:hypothetical protein
MEELPAALAVDRIGFVLGKSAGGALLVHSARPEQYLHHPHKQAHTDDHHYDREQSASLTG